MGVSWVELVGIKSLPSLTWNYTKLEEDGRDERLTDTWWVKVQENGVPLADTALEWSGEDILLKADPVRVESNTQIHPIFLKN